MLALNGVSAWIEVDGKELEQHGIQEDPHNNRVTCWIATQASKNFSVVFKDNATYRDHSLCSSLLLDGSGVSGKILRPLNGNDSRTMVQSDQVLSVETSRPFMFSKLELTEEDEYLNQTAAHLGEIEIRIFRAHCGESRLFRPVGAASGHTKIHERSKKAVTHCVSYGKEVKTTMHYTCSVKYLDDRKPLVTFIFRYRDLGLLQANGIVHRPPPATKKAKGLAAAVKPEPADEEIEIVNDVPPQQKKMVVLAKRSSSRRGSEAKPGKRIKQESFASPSEVIDLT